MTKSPIQIASELVSDCPGTFKMTSGQRQLLIGMIAEELERRRQFYKRRCDDLQRVQNQMRDPERKMVCDILANGMTYEKPDPLSQVLNEGNGVYKP